MFSSPKLCFNFQLATILCERKYTYFQKRETSVEAGSNKWWEQMCVIGFQIKEIPIDGLRSQLNYKLINLIGKKILMTFMPQLRSVDKGAFLLVRECVIHLCGLIIWLDFTPKITKIQELPGALPPGPPPLRYPGPTGCLKAVPDLMPLKKKNPRPPPPNQNTWIRPCKPH